MIMSFHARKNQTAIVQVAALLLVGVLLSASASASASASSVPLKDQYSFRNLQETPNPNEDFSCDTLSDECPTRFNEVCDDPNIGDDDDDENGSSSSGDPKCRAGDCFDCNRCAIYDYDCGGCLAQRGCVWCPGDALCYNSPFFIHPGASCQDPLLDYRQGGGDLCYAKTGEEPFFDDPLYAAEQWVYDMIHLRDVWETFGYFGQGIRVRVNDNGIESSHPEFAEDNDNDNRIDFEASCDNTVDPPMEELLLPVGVNHGTSVAGILGGGANNGVCSVGVAPQVTISSCYVFGDQTTPNLLIEKLDMFDISQNSWGLDGCRPVRRRDRERELQGGGGGRDCPFNSGSGLSPCNFCDFDSSSLSNLCEGSIIQYCRNNYENDQAACLEFLDLLVRDGLCEFQTLSETDSQDLVTGVLEGRDGKGIIYVFASGNSFYTGDNTNFQSFPNSRLVISVGAVGKDGKHASYSTPGASLFVSGPGGDRESLSNHVTAGLDGSCTDASTGTSFACPVVSGVIALVLEANPELTWRDVQGIIATTSQPVDDDPDDDTDQVNGAGIWHSNLYGFGIVNALAAVEAAETWGFYGPEEMIIGESGMVNLPLSETAIATSVITISEDDTDAEGFVAENVNVFLDLQHFSRGHLEVVLTSPQGTKSILSPGQRPENRVLDTDERWKLLTVRHWGESPIGEWTLEILDVKEGDADECANAAWILPNSNGSIDCNAMASVQWCFNGSLDPFQRLDPDDFDFIFSAEDNGLTAEEACCECGGGLNTDEVEDELRQWRLVVYGRDRSSDSSTTIPEIETAAPTASPVVVSAPPTSLPTMGKTTPPTSSPVAVSSPPTESPMMGETTPPTSSPVVVSVPPTESPIMGETTPPTSSPVVVSAPPTESPIIGETTPPTSSPVSASPTISPVSTSPTTSPVSSPPTMLPSDSIAATNQPTVASMAPSTMDISSQPSDATFSSNAPSPNPTSNAPTRAPTTSAGPTTSAAPTTNTTAPSSVPTTPPFEEPSPSPTDTSSVGCTLIPNWSFALALVLCCLMIPKYN